MSINIRSNCKYCNKEYNYNNNNFLNFYNSILYCSEECYTKSKEYKNKKYGYVKFISSLNKEQYSLYELFVYKLTDNELNYINQITFSENEKEYNKILRIIKLKKLLN